MGEVRGSLILGLKRERGGGYTTEMGELSALEGISKDEIVVTK